MADVFYVLAEDGRPYDGLRPARAEDVTDEMVERAVRSQYDAQPQCNFFRVQGVLQRGEPKTYEECYGHGPRDDEDFEETRAAIVAALALDQGDAS